MDAKLQDSELKIMEVLWREGDCNAKHISEILNQEVGWNKNTTYTLIKRCIEKHAVQRSEPGFLCHALISREEVQEQQTKELIDKLYGGSAKRLLEALGGKKEENAAQETIAESEQSAEIPVQAAAADSSVSKETVQHIHMLFAEAREILEKM